MSKQKYQVCVDFNGTMIINIEAGTKDEASMIAETKADKFLQELNIANYEIDEVKTYNENEQ